jgi:hypothetical protein
MPGTNLMIIIIPQINVKTSATMTKLVLIGVFIIRIQLIDTVT